MHVITGNMTMS